jgi:hypothetical protein
MSALMDATSRSIRWLVMSSPENAAAKYNATVRTSSSKICIGEIRRK